MKGRKKKENQCTLTFRKDFQRNWSLYLLVLPVIIFYLIFHYVPMYGIIIAFKDYKINLGIMGSPWVGLKHFLSFFENPNFWRLVKNTVRISLSTLIIGMPAPIIFALLVNELRMKKLRSVIQTVSIFPHFVSLVVVCAIIKEFCLSDGLFNIIGGWFGLPAKSLLQMPAAFTPIYVISHLWEKTGWSSLIYLAAIAGIDSQIYEAADIDGASRWKKMWYITLPSIKPTFVILFIMAVGGIMSVGSEKILLLYNESIYSTADVISTYLYRKGLLEFNFSYSTAVNLFNSVINFTLVILANKFSKKISDMSLF